MMSYMHAAMLTMFCTEWNLIIPGLKFSNNNVEVHHYPDLHHKKKNFKEYFLEFLMIFLAVTLGFIAENIRERINESERENNTFNLSLKSLNQIQQEWMILFNLTEIIALNSMYQCYDTVFNNIKATSCIGVLIKYSKVNRPFF